LIDPRTNLIRYVGQSGRDPWVNYYSRYFSGCRHNNWLNNIILKLTTLDLSLQFEIDSWHETEDAANQREQELIALYQKHPKAKLVNILAGGRKGWKSNQQWLRLHNDGMREVSKYITGRNDLESIAYFFLRHTAKQPVLDFVGCTEQYLNQLLRGDIHIDLWEEIPQLLDKVLAHADKHNISLGGCGGGSGTPRDDRPDDLIYQAFEMYNKGLSGHKIKEILDVGVNIYDVLRGDTRSRLLQRWIAEGNAPPDLTREYEYVFSDATLLSAFDLRKEGLEHTEIATIIGCHKDFIAAILRGIKRGYLKEQWEAKNGKLPQSNMQKRLDDSVGFAIFKLRESGLSCTEIASRLDVTRQYVSKILKGLNKPHIKLQWEKEKGLRDKPSNP